MNNKFRMNQNGTKILKQAHSAILQNLTVMLTMKTTKGGYIRYGVVIADPMARKYQKARTCRTISEAWNTFKYLTKEA